MGVTRITQLADEERARFSEWTDRWIAIGLRTGAADRERFEAAVRTCYGYAGISWPGVVVWVPSPLVLCFAAPATALAIEAIHLLQQQGERAPSARAVDSAVGSAVGSAVRSAVHSAVDSAVGSAVGSAVRSAVDSGARDRAPSKAVHVAVQRVLNRMWGVHIGGQFWAGGWWGWGGAWTSYFREVCRLELPGDLWDRGRAYEATIESACWWWPHRRFVMVCERPTVIHREHVDRVWRLHCETGPAVAWPDGWGVWAIHGVRVPQAVVEAPHTLTPAQILAEPNAEVRRVMFQRFGEDRFMRESGATPIHRDAVGELYRVDVADDEPLVMVRVQNSTPEPDGSVKGYWLRVPPDMTEARQAVAWTFGLTAKQYAPVVET